MLRRVRAAHPFPDFTAPMRSSDSHDSVGPALRSSLARGLPRCGRLFLTAGACIPRTCRASESGHRVSMPPEFDRAEAWASQVTGPSSSRVPRSNTPPGAVPTRPLSSEPPSPSTKTAASAPGMNIDFVAATPRPTRSRAYASPAALPHPSQGSLPARAGSPLAGRASHPLDDQQDFTTSSQTSLLPDQHRLVALKRLPSRSWARNRATRTGCGCRAAGRSAR